jgi:hypothetical protein
MSSSRRHPSLHHALVLLSCLAGLSALMTGFAAAQDSPREELLQRAGVPVPAPAGQAPRTAMFMATTEPGPGSPCTSPRPLVERKYPARHAEVPATQRNGVLSVSALLNDCLQVDLYIDSGAAHVFLPASIFSRLSTLGAITAADRRGTDSYTMADGRPITLDLYRIGTLGLGGVEVRDVTAAVGPGEGPALLGMSFLKRFMSWSINNHRQVLVLNVGTLPSPPSDAR